MGKVADVLRPKRYLDPRNGAERWMQSEDFKKLRRLVRLKFTVHHRGKSAHQRIYTIKRVLFDEKYGSNGADALTATFNRRNSDGTVTPNVKIFDFYLERYGGRLNFPDLPILETSRDGLFPMEVCKLLKFQRYAFKLDPEQVSPRTSRRFLVLFY
jgi:eukaryotic translation initiation factor 2C